MRKRKREQYLAGELLESDASASGMDTPGLEGDTSSREDPGSMPSLTGDLTTRLLAALVEENVFFPAPNTTTAPYLPGGAESGMGDSHHGGISYTGSSSDWGVEGDGMNGFGGSSFDLEDSSVRGAKGLKGPAAAKGPKAKQPIGKVKSEAALKTLSGSGTHGAASLGPTTTTPVPLSASSAAITVKKTPWGTVTDVPAIPVRQVRL